LFTNSTGYTQGNKSRAKVLIRIIICFFIAVWRVAILF